ncbi:hypothetical protein MTR_1g041420 [Medicago truncatula]|uniref:Uncharacterized protein n=1 Tax=Medicago truncatula TaxID=3880 RepID=A0A072VHG7_MEDTR|nr:hypothetical protein MTR_1g041420 [Medicago truncatula]
MKYCQQSNLEYETVTFLLERKRINENRQTSRMLKLENGAEIDGMKQQTGGGDAALNNEMVGLKTFGNLISSSIVTLEGFAKSKGIGSSSNIEK